MWLTWPLGSATAATVSSITSFRCLAQLSCHSGGHGAVLARQCVLAPTWRQESLLGAVADLPETTWTLVPLPC
jgi:hypothetical protein